MSPPLAAWRAAWRASPVPGVLLPADLSPEALARLRERVRPALAPFWLPDRGRYEVAEGLPDAEVASVLVAQAGDVLERPLRAVGWRWQRLSHGDYALFRDDAVRRRAQSAAFELVLDFSAAASDEAQVVVTTGAAGLVLPQTPGLALLVGRPPDVRRYDRYLTHRIGEAEVFRLTLALDPA